MQCRPRTLRFDTAPLYNNGVSEARLGHGLEAAGGLAAGAEVWIA